MSAVSPGSKAATTADAMALDAIEDALVSVAVYADLARSHSQAGDIPGLEYDLRVTHAHLRVAVETFKDIAERRAALKQQEAA